MSQRLQDVIKKLKDICPHYRIGQAIVNSVELTDINKLFYMQDSVLLNKLEKHANTLEKLSNKE